MKRVAKFLAFTAVAGIVSYSPAAKAQETWTYPMLVKRLTNLEYLSVLPAKGDAVVYCRDLVVTDPPASLGVHELTAGQHKLTVEIVGSNEKAKDRTLFGLIRLVLEPAK